MDFIIEIERGIVAGVYTNSLENFTVRVMDEDDKHDEERCHEYNAMRKLIESGAVTDILYGNSVSKETPEINIDFPGFYKIMKPLLDKQNQTYNGLCKALNMSEEFDCEEE